MQIFNGSKNAYQTITKCQPTDFSVVTVRPEFVAEGKYFYDETGQLRVGTSKYLSGTSTEDTGTTEGGTTGGGTSGGGTSGGGTSGGGTSGGAGNEEIPLT